MKEKKGKILGTLLFVLLISALIFLIFFREKKLDKRSIEKIEITGIYLLAENDYLFYSKLSEKSIYSTLTLPIIKSRIEKHPYVQKADVEFIGKNKVNIIVTEKDLKGLILGGKEPHLITENFELLPLLPNTKFIDVPVISNPEGVEKIEKNSILKTNDMLQAFKIIEAAEMIDNKLIKKISEINLRDGGDIILTISGLKSSVIFGRNDEARKMIYLEKIFNEVSRLDRDENNIAEGSGYIDLRFSGKIYLGGYQNAGFIE